MATIPGSQFTATASLPVNVVETATGAGLPPTMPGAFNLEVFVGDPNNPPAIALGFQGLAVISPDGHSIDLIQGAFAITDDGDTISAHGIQETISGGAFFVNLILDGNQEVANGGGRAGDNILVNGNTDTVNGGSGHEDIEVHGTGNAVNAGSGADTINVYAAGNVVNGGSGPGTINAFGGSETIAGGSGRGVTNAFGTGNTITAGSGSDTINVFADNNTIDGGSGIAQIGLFSNNDSVAGGSGPGTIIATGANDTVTAGNGNMNIGAWTTNFIFQDNGAALYDDTVMGFTNGGSNTVQLAAGDNVATSTVSNGSTQVVLSDGSKILLVGVIDITGLFHH